MEERKNYITEKQFLKKHPEEKRALDEAEEAVIKENRHLITTVPFTYRVDYDSYLNRKKGTVKTDLFAGIRRITYIYE